MSLLPAVEINPPSKEALRTIIWLHGLGADGNDFVSIVPQLDVPDLQTRFIFPHAPVRAVTINHGAKQRAWFDIYEFKIDAKIDVEGIRESQLALEALIQNENARGIPTKNIMLAGFSQGAVMAMTTGLQYKETLGGIIALSGYLPLASKSWHT